MNKGIKCESHAKINNIIKERNNIGAISMSNFKRNKLDENSFFCMQSGITLVALVVTVVVLLILAGVSINLVLGNNGIITKTQATKYKQQIATMKEELELYIGDKTIEASGSYDSTKLTATNNSLIYNGVKQSGETIKNILTTEQDEILVNYSIVNGELKYLGNDSTESSLFAQVIYGNSSVKIASAQSSTGIVTVSDANEENLDDYKIYGASTQNGTPKPNSPVEFASLGESGNIKLTSCGKNLLDSSKLTAYSSAYGLKFTVLNDGGINFKGTSTRNGGSAFRFVYLNGEHDKLTKLGASYISFGQPNGSIRIDEATGTLAIDITLVLGTNYDFTIYPMAYIGSKPTVYEKYNASTTTINLSEPLRKIGDVSDYIDYSNGRIVRNIKMMTLIGSDTERWWQYGTNGLDIPCLAVSTLAGRKALTKIYSNRDVEVGSDVLYSKLYGIWPHNQQQYASYIYWGIPYSVIGTTKTSTQSENVSAMKLWLKSNNTKVYYQLETPTYEYISLPTVSTYDGATNVYVTDTNGINPSNILISYVQK